MRAAAWLTVHWVECHLLYGKASGRLDGDGVSIVRASIGAGKAAAGLSRATRLNPSHRRRSRDRCSARVRPSNERGGRCRSWRTAGPGPTAGGPPRPVPSTGPAAGARRRAPPRAGPSRPPPRRRRPGHGPTAWPRRPPPRPPRTRRPGWRRSASLISACWGMPSSTRWVRAEPAPHPLGHQPGGVGIGPAALGDGQPVDPRPAAAGAPGVGSGGDQGPGHQFGGLGVARGRAHPDQHRRPRVEGGGPDRGPGWAHRSAGVAVPAGGAGRRGCPPVRRTHHPAHLPPGHRHRPEVERPLAGPFGQVVVGLVGAARLVLEPLPPHAQPGRRRRAAPRRCRPPGGTTGRRPGPTGPAGASRRGRRSPKRAAVLR